MKIYLILRVFGPGEGVDILGVFDSHEKATEEAHTFRKEFMKKHGGFWVDSDIMIQERNLNVLETGLFKQVEENANTKT